MASRFVGKLRGKSVGETSLKDEVDGNESVSCKDDYVVSEEISKSSFSKFGSL